MTLQVELVSARELVWSGDASMVVARTTEGDLGVLTGHAPTLAVLQAGEVRIQAETGESVVARIESGFLSVDHDRVTIVSDSASIVSPSAS